MQVTILSTERVLCHHPDCNQPPASGIYQTGTWGIECRDRQTQSSPSRCLPHHCWGLQPRYLDRISAELDTRGPNALDHCYTTIMNGLGCIGLDLFLWSIWGWGMTLLRSWGTCLKWMLTIFFSGWIILKLEGIGPLVRGERLLSDLGCNYFTLRVVCI